MDILTLTLLDSSVLVSIFVLAKAPAGNLAAFRLICKQIKNIIDGYTKILSLNGDLRRGLPSIPSPIVLPNVHTLQLRTGDTRANGELCSLIRLLDGRFRHLRLFFGILSGDAMVARDASERFFEDLSHAIAACKAPLQAIAICHRAPYIDRNAFTTAAADLIMSAHPGLLHLELPLQDWHLQLQLDKGERVLWWPAIPAGICTFKARMSGCRRTTLPVEALLSCGNLQELQLDEGQLVSQQGPGKSEAQLVEQLRAQLPEQCTLHIGSRWQGDNERVKQLLQSGADGIDVHFGGWHFKDSDVQQLLHEIASSAPAHVRKLGLLSANTSVTRSIRLRDATCLLDGQLPHLQELQLSFYYLDTLDYFRKMLAKRVGGEVLEVRQWCIPRLPEQGPGQVDVTVRPVASR